MRYLEARNGDDAGCPFECDYCIFRKLYLRNPDPQGERDKFVMAVIRRMVLDAFWSKARSTVKGNVSKMKLGIQLMEDVGLGGPYERRKPFPPYDHCGYQVAMQVLLYSRRTGRLNANHCQFETVRRMRSVFSNFVRASPNANTLNLSLSDVNGAYSRFNTDSSGSYWFQLFMRGCANRMGSDTRKNQAMSSDLFLHLLRQVELRILESESPEEINRWIVFHTYSVVSYVISLRGAEGFMLDLGTFHRYLMEKPEERLIIGLYGKTKGETHDRSHLFPCVNVTSSGVDVRRSVLRLLNLKARSNVQEGPAITDERGVMIDSKAIDDCLHEALKEILNDRPELFPKHIQTEEDIETFYHSYRTYRRTSTSRATNQGVARPDIDIVNRWTRIERAGGRKFSAVMAEHYTDVLMTPDAYLRYTKAM